MWTRGIEKVPYTILGLSRSDIDWKRHSVPTLGTKLQTSSLLKEAKSVNQIPHSFKASIRLTERRIQHQSVRQY